VADVTLTVNVTVVPRTAGLGLTVAVAVHGAAGTVVVGAVVVGGNVVVVVVVGGNVVVVVVVVVVVAGAAAVTTKEAAAPFQRYSEPQPGEKTPTITEWVSRASPAGTVHVAVNVRATPAVNAWLSHTWVNGRD
jgi:hypothetical protein